MQIKIDSGIPQKTLWGLHSNAFRQRFNKMSGMAAFVVPLQRKKPIGTMKKLHIILLLAVAVVIAGLLTMMKDLTTYDTIASARGKEGKYVHLIAKLDKTRPVEYDPVKDPNYLSFYALDSLGGQTRVVYRNSKPTEFEHSERIVLKGKMRGDVFECNEILLKCPSKYKDDPTQQMKKLEDAGTAPATSGIEKSDPSVQTTAEPAVATATK
jgi:cytochrome c-type biogenesis protein CcmE